MHKLSLQTHKRLDIVDLTSAMADYLAKEKYQDGILLVFSPHTTAAITVNENADPDVKHDLSSFLAHLVPQDANFHHVEGNADAHIKGSLLNFSQTFIVEKGKLQLGTWQGIFFMELDGPRSREVWLKFIPA